MIILDTSVLIDAIAGTQRSALALRRVLERGERTALPALVLYEWFRGSRRPEELARQDALWPEASALAFGPAEAAVAADLYRQVRRPRGREMDLAIAACAICADAELWTLNTSDFADVPGLTLTVSA